ncbi:MAG: tetratricopeptide repeat protein [Fimbriimonadales bacterium]
MPDPVTIGVFAFGSLTGVTADLLSRAWDGASERLSTSRNFHFEAAIKLALIAAARSLESVSPASHPATECIEKWANDNLIPDSPKFPKELMKQFVRGDVAAVGTFLIPHIRACTRRPITETLADQIEARLPEAFVAAFAQILKQQRHNKALIAFQTACWWTLFETLNNRGQNPPEKQPPGEIVVAKHLESLIARLEETVRSAISDEVGVLRPKIDEILADIALVKVDTSTVLKNQEEQKAADEIRHTQVIEALANLTKPSPDLSAELQRLEAQDERHKAQIERLLQEREEILARGNVHENILEQALIAFAQQKLDEALALYDQVEAVVDTVAVRVHKGKGDVFMRQHRFPDAEGQYRKASALKDDDPDLLNDLLLALHFSGKRKDAISVAERIVALRGPDLRHPDTLMSMNNLAETYGAMGRHADALELHKAVLEASKEVLGERHTLTLASVNNLAETYGAMGRHADALELHKEVLEASKEVLGERHPRTLVSMNNLAETYRAMGRHADALELQEEVLAAKKEVLGERHPSTLASVNNLAETYGAMGRHAAPWSSRRKRSRRRKKCWRRATRTHSLA